MVSGRQCTCTRVPSFSAKTELLSEMLILTYGNQILKNKTRTTSKECVLRTTFLIFFK